MFKTVWVLIVFSKFKFLTNKKTKNLEISKPILKFTDFVDLKEFMSKF